MEEKEQELRHKDARFLAVVTTSHTLNMTVTKSDTSNDDEMRDPNKSNISEEPNQTLLGFAHFRYESDDEECPKIPITYLMNFKYILTI